MGVGVKEGEKMTCAFEPIDAEQPAITVRPIQDEKLKEIS
jgi:hypothetical protein